MKNLVLVFAALCAPLSAQVCGDCDRDGRVDIVDALLAAEVACGLLPVDITAIDFAACDVSGDADVTILDALLIAMHTIDRTTALSCS